MVDFIGSLNKGLSAAQQAERNKVEIYSVFEVLNTQLVQGFDGKLEINTYTKANPFANIGVIINEPPKPGYSFIGAVNPLSETKSPSELARWKLDSNGYPCQIITSEDELYCENKEALERGLQDLLSRPDVGEKIYAVMKQKLKPTKSE